MSDPTMAEEVPPAARASRGAPPEAVWRWLEKGWQDFRRAPSVGLAYGIGAVALSYAVCFGLVLGGKAELLLPATGGFFILAPMIVSGLYDVSRRLESGQPVSLRAALFAWRSSGQILLMGGVLLFLHIVWIRLALLLSALFLHGVNPSLEGLLPLMFGSSRGLALLVVGTIVGGGLALLSFYISAVSLPLIVDRDVSVPDAIARSINTVNENIHAMGLWAALIVVFTGIGIATAFIGLAIVVPVLAHATWHAYRELVPREG
jgi:uncharacterized membrane protein